MNVKLTVRQNMEPSEMLNAYLKEIDKYKPLSKEEESALFDIIDAGNAASFDMNYCKGHEYDPDYLERIESNEKAIAAAKEAKDKIILHNQKFIYAVAKRISQDDIVLDLITEGTLGLIEAFDDYDRSKKTRFITHASWRIERNMNNFKNNTRLLITRPNNIINNYRVRRFEDKFLAENGRIPTQEETFDAITESGKYFPKKEDMYDVEYLPIYKNKKENEGWASDDDGDTQPIQYIEVTSEDNEYENKSDDDYNKELVNTLMSVLNDKEKEVIRLYYAIDDNNDEMTNKEIGFKLGLTSERVRQIKKSAIEKMKQVSYKNV